MSKSAQLLIELLVAGIFLAVIAPHVPHVASEMAFSQSAKDSLRRDMELNVAIDKSNAEMCRVLQEQQDNYGLDERERGIQARLCKAYGYRTVHPGWVFASNRKIDGSRTSIAILPSLDSPRFGIAISCDNRHTAFAFIDDKRGLNQQDWVTFKVGEYIQEYPVYGGGANMILRSDMQELVEWLDSSSNSRFSLQLKADDRLRTIYFDAARKTKDTVNRISKACS